MSRPFLARRRCWPLYLLLAAAGLVVVAAAGLVAEAAFSPQHRENFRLPPVSPLPGASNASRDDRAPGRTRPGSLLVIQGRRLAAGGIRAGFPHTLEGAVSAAVQDWTWAACDLDPASMKVIGRVIAAPSWRGGPAALAAGARRTRVALGLAAAGSVPAAVRVTFTAVEYQVRDASRHHVTVLLLAHYTAAVPGHQFRASAGVYPVTMRWAHGDWKLAAPGGPDYSWLDARPGSPQAAASGWHRLYY